MNETEKCTCLELKGAKEMLVAMQKIIDKNKEDILALRTALDKANEKLAYAFENPPYYDCEAGKEQLKAWSESWTHWFDVKEILPDENEFVLITDGEDYAVGTYREDAHAWEHWCYGWLEREKEGEEPARLGKITHWKPFPRLGEHE